MRLARCCESTTEDTSSSSRYASAPPDRHRVASRPAASGEVAIVAAARALYGGCCREAGEGDLGAVRVQQLDAAPVMASALDVSATVAYGTAADKLLTSGRFAGVAEKWGLAVEAGRALGAPDCLVVANAQARHLHQLAPLADKR